MTFVAGCAGGLLAFLIIFVLPELREIRVGLKAARKQGIEPAIGLSAKEILISGLVGLGLVIVGGAAAFMLYGGSEFKDGMAYGIAGEALLGGLIRSG